MADPGARGALGHSAGCGQPRQSALDFNKADYEAGVRVNVDVLNAQGQLFQTQANLARARYDVLLGALKLRQASGVLMPADLTALHGLLVE